MFWSRAIENMNGYAPNEQINGLTDEMYEKEKTLAETIIQNDPNFMNGYVVLLQYYDYKGDCVNYDKYKTLELTNYI